MRFLCTLPLLKKNDNQDALKREANTTHISAFTLARLRPSLHPVAGSLKVCIRSMNETMQLKVLLNHY
jgi:hypothetical protein